MRIERTTSDEKRGLLWRRPPRLGGPTGAGAVLLLRTGGLEMIKGGVSSGRMACRASERGFFCWWATVWPTFTSDCFSFSRLRW